jgi:hypothetical protein
MFQRNRSDVSQIKSHVFVKISLKAQTWCYVHVFISLRHQTGKRKKKRQRARKSFKLLSNKNSCVFHFLAPFQGTFRLSCEHVLKSLKRGRETLLTLLEAFVYDPLVDWAVGEDNATGGLANLGTGAEKGSSNATTDLTAARKHLEREVTRDTLAIRFTEIKADWTQNRWVIGLLYTSCHIGIGLRNIPSGIAGVSFNWDAAAVKTEQNETIARTIVMWK